MLNLISAQLERLPRKAWLVFALLCIFGILIMGLQPGVKISMPLLFPNDDKLKHFLAFMLMSSFLFRWRYPFDPARPPLGFMPWLPVIALPFLVGFMDETIQAFVPGRSSDYMDLFADSMGGMMALVLGLYSRKQAKKCPATRVKVQKNVVALESAA